MAPGYVPRNPALSVPPENAIADAAAHVMFHDTRSNRLAKRAIDAIQREPLLRKAADFGDISAAYVER